MMTAPLIHEPVALSFDLRQVSLFRTDDSFKQALLRDVTVQLSRDSITCIIGASGSGKSLLLKLLLGLLDPRRWSLTGMMNFFPPSKASGDHTVPEDGQRGECGVIEAALEKPRRTWFGRSSGRTAYESWCLQLGAFYGTYLGYVPQYGPRALDPSRTVGGMVRKAITRRSSGLTRLARHQEALLWLERLGFDHPERVITLYPYQLSGGMAQRVSIAIALARGARMILADEPTTGLDQDSQTALLRLLLKLREKGWLESLLVVTHDLSVAQTIADSLLVLSEGRVVETLSAGQMFSGTGPDVPQSQDLWLEHRKLAEHREGRQLGIPEAQSHPGGKVGVLANHLVHSYREGLFRRHAVLQGATLLLRPGEIVGLQGSSGAGKSTFAACVAGLLFPDRGSVHVNGLPLRLLGGKAYRKVRRNLQLLFQSPHAALHPNMRVIDALRETALYVAGLSPTEAAREVDRVLKRVGLEDRAQAFPEALSGGELRRVGIARILIVKPDFLVVDEPTACVDASLRAGILQLLEQLNRGPGRTGILLISHDSDVIGFLSHRVLLMRRGQIVRSDGMPETYDIMSAPFPGQSLLMRAGRL